MSDKPEMTDAMQAAVDALGDPKTKDMHQQHDTIVKTVFQSLELARLGGYDPRIIGVAVAAATVAYTSNLGSNTRLEIGTALRQCADEIEETGVTPMH